MNVVDSMTDIERRLLQAADDADKRKDYAEGDRLRDCVNDLMAVRHELGRRGVK